MVLAAFRRPKFELTALSGSPIKSLALPGDTYLKTVAPRAWCGIVFMKSFNASFVRAVVGLAETLISCLCWTKRSARGLGKLKTIFYKTWESPTLMTWGSFSTRILNFFVILPLIVTRFSTSEITLWYLFMTIINLQVLVDLGFSPTFTRVLAFAMGGASPEELKSPILNQKRNPNWNCIEIIFSTMRWLYDRLSLAWPVLLGAFGTMAVCVPISRVEDTKTAWMAWGVVLLVSVITLRGNLYSSFLQGLNKVAMVRRWEMLASLGVICTCTFVLLTGGKLLELIIAHQAWQVVNVLRNRWLTYRVEGKRFKNCKITHFNNKVFQAVWPSAWRSGLGVLMSYGLIQASGLLYAQVGTSDAVASYLLALRFIQMISQFSQAPFYSKLPLLARMFAENRHKYLLEIAQKGMRLSYWSYISAFLILGLFGKTVLEVIGSNANFPEPFLWSLLGIGFFIERYGAMHLQLFSITNCIVWHIANGVTGLIFFVTSMLFFHKLDVYAFPVGIISGYLGFYAWYAALHSYKSFGLKFFPFEKLTSLVPLTTLVLYLCGVSIFFLR